jgi:hypothetical protein
MVQVDDIRTEVTKRDQEILGLSAKLKAVEDQNHDFQHHINLLKEGLMRKEEHQGMVQNEVRGPAGGLVNY